MADETAVNLSIPAIQEDVKHLFKHTLSSVGVVLDNGTRVNFTKGIYLTNDPYEIEQLERMAADRNNNFISIDPNKRTMDANDVVPMNRLRKELTEEILADIQRANSDANITFYTSSADAGSSKPVGDKPQVATLDNGNSAPAAEGGTVKGTLSSSAMSDLAAKMSASK